ncbi:nuclear speckle splicing regulatory protein 1-like [Condylostylus longicornis]|uniref:nuclear speckle splicing regulatory protein 1-like n=1 Tax=Condylostylus longicornis TaxID=2530218 RepID=UPI00244E3272|nr:nuclear speckle splicing regulatory protein 1-like [Condylostylus longicornis]
MFSFKLGKKTTVQSNSEAEAVAVLFQEAEEVEELQEEALIRGRIAPLKVDIGEEKKNRDDLLDLDEDPLSSEDEKSSPIEEPPKEVKKPEKEAGLVYKGGGKDLPPPRYVGALAERATKREMELEIVKERLLKRQREEEGESEVKDEEVFVTGAYKKRLEERQAYEQKMVEKDLQDALNDPKKKKNLMAFHSHMLSSGMASRSKGGDVDEKPRKRRREDEKISD